MNIVNKQAVLDMIAKMLDEEAPVADEFDIPVDKSTVYRSRKKDDFKWTIYGITEPDSCFIKYVGFTSRPLGDRVATHLSQANRAALYPVSRWIRGLLLRGLKPDFKELEVGYGGDWAAREKFWIKLCRMINKDLKNMTDGGDGRPGYKVTDAMRENMRGNHHSKFWQVGARMVLCLNNSLVYRSCAEACRLLGVSASGVCMSIKENRATKSYRFRYFGTRKSSFHNDDPLHPPFTHISELDESKC